jgi:hypothetical protein
VIPKQAVADAPLNLPERKRSKKRARTPEQMAKRAAQKRARRQEVRGEIPREPYSHDSRLHVALKYMKMVHDWVSYKELTEFSPIFCDTHISRSSLTRDMQRVKALGYVEVQPPPPGKAVKGASCKFRITPKGIVHLYTSARLWAEDHPFEDDEDFSDSDHACQT